MAHSTLPITNQAETDRSTALSLFVSLRPSQWTKNLIVFAALLFGERGGAPAFLDPHGDRTRARRICHLLRPVGRRLSDQRRRRPGQGSSPSDSSAGGRLPREPSPRRWRSGPPALLAAVALLGSFALRPAFALVALTYVALLALYSGPLKHVVIIDVLTIAIGFVLRAVAGAVAIDVRDQSLAAHPHDPAGAVPGAEQAPARAGHAGGRRHGPSADPRGVQPVSCSIR